MLCVCVHGIRTKLGFQARKFLITFFSFSKKNERQHFPVNSFLAKKITGQRKVHPYIQFTKKLDSVPSRQAVVCSCVQKKKLAKNMPPFFTCMSLVLSANVNMMLPHTSYMLDYGHILIKNCFANKNHINYACSQEKGRERERQREKNSFFQTYPPCFFCLKRTFNFIYEMDTKSHFVMLLSRKKTKTKLTYSLNQCSSNKDGQLKLP